MNNRTKCCNFIVLSHLVVLVLLLACVCMLSCEKPAPKRNVVATVGDAALSLDEAMSDIPPQIRPNMTSMEIRQHVLRWVDNQVLYQEALKLKLDESNELKAEFQKLKIELLVNALIEEALESDVTVTDAEIEVYYESNEEQFRLPEDRVHAYHICVNSRTEANEVRRRLRRGDAFPDIVASIESDSLNLEWDLGYFSKDEIIPEIAKVVFTLRSGRYSQPIQSPLGYHVVKVIDKKSEGDLLSLEMVREEIRLKLLEQKKQQNYKRFLRQVKSNYDITTNFRLLDSVVLDSLIRQGD